jgi:hypothetical protein
MERQADLHVHTNLSDGTFTPREVVENAMETGLSCIAITDHDCVDGVEPARKAAGKKGPEIIAGVEMTAQEAGREVHILGYFPDLEDTRFRNRLEAIRKKRIDRVYRIVEKLKKYNITLRPEEVFKVSGPGSVGRMHIASVMEDKGYVSSIKEAFSRYIGDKGPCYVPHYEIAVREAIAELKKVGSVVVYAHPQLMGGTDLVDKFAKYGLDGIEVYHSEQSKAVSSRLAELAKDKGLLITGGSDCHGANKGSMLMGTVTVPYSLVEKLKECAKKT